MRQATIHIGLPKTGTTSIQRFLLVNADTLEGLGFRYPRFLDRENHLQLEAYDVGRVGVHMAAIAGVKDLDHWLAWRAQFSKAFRQATAEDGHWIFSSEHIASRNTTTERVKSLGSLLCEAFDSLRFVVYLRRQDEVAISSCSTWVATAATSPLTTMLSSRMQTDMTLGA